MKPALTFGIAGHVDHGKTSLVRALTGQDTDRLAEEKRRGISIELGFAHLDVDVGGTAARIGVVDMPGHERFVRRMIAGTAGIDAVIMVIAADEGVMPQGREHLAICELLGVRRGVVALTKIDLADADLLELVEEDIAEQLRGSFLEGAPLLRFSARDPEAHLAGFRQALGSFCGELLADGRGAALTSRPFRLPVDRCFSMKGRGTVVTGTAASGAIAIGDVLRVWPHEIVCRAREIERHGQAVEHFSAPGRVALNLAKVAVDEVPVGAVLGPPETLVLTDRVDVELTLLGHARKPWRRRQVATMHVGTTSCEAAFTQLEGVEHTPGERRLVQVHLPVPLALAPGERFVVRGSQLDQRNGQTIAGGRILHLLPPRHRLGDERALAALRQIAEDDIGARVQGLLAIAGIRGLSGDELRLLDAGGPSAVDKALQKAVATSQARKLGNPQRYFLPAAVEALEERLLATVTSHHAAHPDRAGITLEGLLNAAGAWLSQAALEALCQRLVQHRKLKAIGQLLAAPDHKPKLLAARPEVVASLLRAVARHDLATPGLAELAALCDPPPQSAEELRLAVAELADSGQVLRVNQDYYVTAEQLRAATRSLFAAHGEQESFTTGDLKAIVGLTRKHLIPLAELLDGKRVTVRDPSGNRRFRHAARQALAAGDDPI